MISIFEPNVAACFALVSCSRSTLTPVAEKSELVETLKEAISKVEDFCKERDVDLQAIQDASGFERIKLLDDAVEAIIVNDESKRRYISLASDVMTLFKAILP